MEGWACECSFQCLKYPRQPLVMVLQVIPCPTRRAETCEDMCLWPSRPLSPSMVSATWPQLWARGTHGRSFCCLNLFACWQITTHVALAECPPHGRPLHCQEPCSRWVIQELLLTMIANYGCLHHQVKKCLFIGSQSLIIQGSYKTQMVELP